MRKALKELEPTNLHRFDVLRSNQLGILSNTPTQLKFKNSSSFVQPTAFSSTWIAACALRQ
jgi:hypothetical protein